MAKAKKEKSVKATKPKYTVLLDYNEKVVELTGDDLVKIFQDYEPDVYKSMVNVTVKSGDKSVERLWPVIKARRVFRNYKNSEIEAELFLKFLSE